MKSRRDPRSPDEGAQAKGRQTTTWRLRPICGPPLLLRPKNKSGRFAVTTSWRP